MEMTIKEMNDVLHKHGDTRIRINKTFFNPPNYSPAHLDQYINSNKISYSDFYVILSKALNDLNVIFENIRKLKNPNHDFMVNLHMISEA